MIELVLAFFSNYLIEFMMGMLAASLVFRFVAYRHSKLDEAYFSKFTREMELVINEDKLKNANIDNVDNYLANLLGRVSEKLPDRSLRFKNKDKEKGNRARSQTLNLSEFMSSKEGLVASIQGESGVFNCKTPPNFSELTFRILSQDKNWTKVGGWLPIAGGMRLIDILPSLFIVFGVFGTFIGISQALPEIANIDFNNLEASQSTLTNFVINVTFAMKTSIAGIFFSLILTFLNTLSPIKGTRQRIFKKVENSFQVLWYHVQSDQRSQEEIFRDILGTLKDIAGKIKPSNDQKIAS